MIVVLAGALPRLVSADELEVARTRLAQAPVSQAGVGTDVEVGVVSWKTRVRSGAGWSDAAGYAVSDLTMLRRELVVGFVVAGFGSALVPEWVWRSVFVTGHGFGSSLENAVLGPGVALVSFVCSVGNVPLAAALWKGGISFGGTMAFVFADLISLPLLAIARRYYGTRITLRLLGVFWTAMSFAGLSTEYLFKAAGLVPAVHLGKVVTTGFHLDATSVLDAAGLAVFALMYGLHRNRKRSGSGVGYANDVICGMQVEIAHAAALTRYGTRSYYFCSDRCHDRFVADPARYLGTGPERRPESSTPVPVQLGRKPGTQGTGQ